ncbi:MAG: hypothetical protein Q4B96_06165 [Bacillota bacterium]|nr:hypothetical protein [Bacillota bacterium]
MNNRGYRWFLAGTMLGAAGAYMGMGMNKKPMRKTRKAAAHMADEMSDHAGDLIDSLGDALAKRLR